MMAAAGFGVILGPVQGSAGSSTSSGCIDSGPLFEVEGRARGAERRKMSPLNSFVIKDDAMLSMKKGGLHEEIGATDSLTFPTFQQFH
jgi:hypothetical protein